VKFSLLLLSFLFGLSAHAQSALDQVLANSQSEQLDLKIKSMEKRIQELTHNSVSGIAERTNLTTELKEMRQEKGRRLLMRAIEDTDTSKMMSEDIKSESMRLTPRKGKTDGSVLSKIADNTIKESNPALAGRDLPEGRPLVLYRDVDPADVYVAKELGKGDKKVIVYKVKDLRGREVFKTIDGQNSTAIIEKRLFPKEEVIIMDESGKLQKAYPKAIYPDGTLEMKDQYGMTARRRLGAYHLTETAQKVQGNQVMTYSNQKVNAFADNSEHAGLSAQEKKAMEALRKALCNL
jgi:regulator of replication initiation timing